MVPAAPCAHTKSSANCAAVHISPATASVLVPSRVPVGYPFTMLTAWPSRLTEVAVPPPASHEEWTIAAADLAAPNAPSVAALSASPLKSANRGNANADRIPRITITMISSIRVKPDCCLFIEFILTTSFVLHVQFKQFSKPNHFKNQILVITSPVLALYTMLLP